jgi:hypothetical protein
MPHPVREDAPRPRRPVGLKRPVGVGVVGRGADGSGGSGSSGGSKTVERGGHGFARAQ